MSNIIRFRPKSARANRRKENTKIEEFDTCTKEFTRLKFGKHKGKTHEEVLLKHPDYAQWMIEHLPESAHQAIISRMQDFDDKPFTADCDREYGRKATRVTACGDSSGLCFWCDECDPLSNGARRVAIIYSLTGLLQHVDANADGNRALKRRIVRRLAAAKGLPKRVGEKEALDFFSQVPTYNDGATVLSSMARRPARLRKRGRFATFRR
jgi:hypothetical protein